VGTHEGACIVYDLKTATRLYVLESHQHPITALSWAPDGRRLVTMSLDESKLVVWKVGVGIFSMFTTGAAPRQGSLGTGAATPFKTLDFNVGDEG
jgi:WD40 repeat protein